MRRLTTLRRRLRRPKRVEVVILGHQKGGTTAVAELLGGMCGKSVSIDPFYVVDRGNADAVERVFRGEISLSSVAKRRGGLFRQQIVKDPDFTFLWPQVTDLYPDARFVYVARSPQDSIRSILQRLGLPGTPPDGPIPPMRNSTRHWELILSGRLPPTDGGDYVDVLAQRWQRAVNTYTEHRDEIRLIRYEDFVQDKLYELRQLARDLGLSVSRDITSKLDVTYQPSGRSGTELQSFFGTERLERIMSLCARGARELGYA